MNFGVRSEERKHTNVCTLVILIVRYCILKSGVAASANLSPFLPRENVMCGVEVEIEVVEVLYLTELMSGIFKTEIQQLIEWQTGE